MAKKPRTKRAAAGRGKAPAGSARTAAPESAHARRVRLYLAKHPGATKAQARGHKPAEHATRAAKARRDKRLTENERAAIRRYARQQAKRMGEDAGELGGDMIRWAQDKGFKVFERAKRLRDRLGKAPPDVRIRTKNGVTELVGDTRKRDRNLDAMDDFTDTYELPDPRWLWYR